MHRSSWIDDEHDGFCHTVLYFLGKLEQSPRSWIKKKKKNQQRHRSKEYPACSHRTVQVYLVLYGLCKAKMTALVISNTEMELIIAAKIQPYMTYFNGLFYSAKY